MAIEIKAGAETHTFQVFANGEFWGTWDAETEEQAIQMAADECGADGDAEVMTAKQISA